MQVFIVINELEMDDPGNRVTEVSGVYSTLEKATEIAQEIFYYMKEEGKNYPGMKEESFAEGKTAYSLYDEEEFHQTTVIRMELE